MGEIDRRSPNPPNAPYKFSPEELQVLSRCNRDSFYQRSLPFGALMGMATYYGVKAGYLKSNPTFGAGLKVAGAIAVGYFLGKLSYQQKCAEMIMQLPNSELGEMLRNRRLGKGGASNSEILTLDPSFGAGTFPSFGSSAPSKDVYSDLDLRPYTDLDMDRPLNEGLNDSFRPSLDYSALEDDSALPAAQQGPVTYEELRKKNRDEYSQQKTNLYRNQPSTQIPPPADQNPVLPTPPPQYQPPPTPPDRDFPSRSNTYGINKEKNKYGDVWEK